MRNTNSDTVWHANPTTPPQNEVVKKSSPEPQSVEVSAPFQFLLTCSDTLLDNFELAKLSQVANLRSELHRVLDDLIDANNQASLARLFKSQGRERILRELAKKRDPIAEAKEKIRKKGRTPEDLVPILSMPPDQAHRTASLTYQQRNIDEGKCCVCPSPLARNSVRYCEKHLTDVRERARVRARKRTGNPPITAAIATTI
jgi:hypothetical protein